MDIDIELSIRVIAEAALTRRVSEAALPYSGRGGQNRRRVRGFYPHVGHRDGLANASGWCGEHPVPQGGHFFRAKSRTKRRIRNQLL